MKTTATTGAATETTTGENMPEHRFQAWASAERVYGRGATETVAAHRAYLVALHASLGLADDGQGNLL